MKLARLIGLRRFLCGVAVTLASTSPAFAVVYDFDNQVWGTSSIKLNNDAGRQTLIEITENLSTPANDVLIKFSNQIPPENTEPDGEAVIKWVYFDTGNYSNLITGISIWEHSDGVQMTIPGSRPNMNLGNSFDTYFTEDFSAGMGEGYPANKNVNGINPGEYLTLNVTLGAGKTMQDLIDALSVGRNADQNIARTGVRISEIVHRIWGLPEDNDHAAFVIGKIIDSSPATAPVITAITAVPASILDTEGSTLSVAAMDPDGGPLPLSYQWKIVSGGGLLNNANSTNPIYTPADVVGTQNVTLQVQVTDGNSTTKGNLTLEVRDANPPPPGLALLVENFDSGSLPGWSINDEGTISAPSRWILTGGELAQRTDINDGSGLSDLAHLGTYISYNAGLQWTDYRMKFAMRTTYDNASMGVMFRVQDEKNYYRLTWNKQQGQRRLVKNVNGVFTLLAADNVIYAQHQNYQVEIVAQGEQLEVWIDGVRIFQVSDATHRQGTIALHTSKNNSAFFDGVRIVDLSGGVFNAKPTITSISATPSIIYDNGSSTLSVVAVDPDNGPQPLKYQWTIVSGGGILNNSNSTNPIYVPIDGVGSQSIMLQVQVTDGDAMTKGDLTLQVRDANPPPPGLQLLYENFGSGSLAGWSIRDEGTITAPSRWIITGGELAQRTDINDGSALADLPHLGTYTSYDNGQEWTDYRMKFAMRTTYDNASMGVMFRIQDSENYYRFTWNNQQKQRRLVKKVNGIFTLLAADSVTYKQHQSYQVEIVSQGDQLEVWIDGERIFQVSDAAHRKGTIALHTSKNNSAYFDNVEVNSTK